MTLESKVKQAEAMETVFGRPSYQACRALERRLNSGALSADLAGIKIGSWWYQVRIEAAVVNACGRPIRWTRPYVYAQSEADTSDQRAVFLDDLPGVDDGVKQRLTAAVLARETERWAPTRTI